MFATDKCDFCNEFGGGVDNAFAIRYAAEVRCRSAFETGAFAVLPTLGQIVPGYLLVVPKHHHLAIGDMSQDEIQELEALRAMLLATLGASYGTYVFFEHGTRSENCGGCGITHAHLHAVPFSAHVDPVGVLKGQFAFDQLQGFSDLARVPSNSSYLYYEATSKERYAFYPSVVPSQYLRRLLAEAIGVRDWDWRECGKEERFLSTLSHTAKMFAGIHDSCSHLARP